MRKRLISAAVVCLVAGAAVFAVSWLLVDPHLELAETYPGGTVLRDNAGTVLRVSLGPGDVDCRPYYVADPDGKAFVWAENDKGKLEKRSVTLGDYDPELDAYPVLEGLSLSDYIIHILGLEVGGGVIVG